MQDSYVHKGLRRRLMKQVREKGIRSESVLSAMSSVPRHLFFEEALLSHAYEDRAFPIGEGQTISQPYTVAFQSELLGPIKGQRVLEIGTGSGYQAAVLSEMGADVFSVEYNRSLFLKARQILHTLGHYPHLFHGDGSVGRPAFAPYAAILVTAAAPRVPKVLLSQLSINGCLVIPTGDRKKQQMLRITKHKEDSFQKECFSNFCFVPLRGAEGWP